MKTNTPRSKRAFPRWWLLAIPLVIIVLWLVGVGIFRQTTFNRAAVASTAQPPSNLNTAQDYLALGDYEIERGNTDAAVRAYSRAIELDPAYPEAYNNRAYVYMVQENYSSALPDLDRAIALRPNYTNARMNRGDIHNYYYQIDYGLAVADYDYIFATDPDAVGNTSLCGHRLLATHHGWNLGVFGELFTRGLDAGCPDQPIN